MRALRSVLLVGSFSALLLAVALAHEAAPAVQAATFTVTSTGDGADSNTADNICNDGSGACTLRAAIEQANATAGADTIGFNIPGAGPHTITPGSSLPAITDTATIDGYTEPGASPNTLSVGNDAVLKIEVVGGLSIAAAGNSTIRGLVINGPNAGISLSANNVLEGNFIGTNVSGTADATTAGQGVSTSLNTRVGGPSPAARNVISGFGIGIVAAGNDGEIQGNYIGTNADGTAALGNSISGIELISTVDGTLIGGSAPGEGNLISGNFEGINDGGDDGDSTVQGNLVGTDATGSFAVPNTVGADIHGGGTVTFDRNVISGNTAEGVTGTGRGIVALGNLVGTAANGVDPLGNGADGMFVAGDTGTIGGTGPGEANVIAYNGGRGIANNALTMTIRANSIHSNGGMGIDNFDGGNGEPLPPVVTAAGSASGTSCANCTIDVFSDHEDEGRIYHGSTTANGLGNWSFAGGVAGPNITATSTDAAGLTSEFSAPFACTTCVGGPPVVGGMIGLVDDHADARSSDAEPRSSLSAMALVFTGLALIGAATFVVVSRRTQRR
jgi:CSLREA domain-containing protein